MLFRSLQKQDRGTKQREQSTAIQGAKISHDGIQHAKIHFKVRISKTSISHTSRPFSHRSNQGAKISHTSIQGAKFIPVCESRYEFPKWQFRTPLFKVRKFLHRAKLPLGTRVPFRTPQATFRTVRNKVRKFRTIKFKVRNSQFKVRKFPTVKFKVAKTPN